MPLWIPIAFFSVFLWVGNNLFDKFLLERFRHDDDQDTDANTLFMFSSAFAIPTGLLALFMGATGNVTPYEFLIGVTVGLLNGLYLLFYVNALAKTELSRIAPIFQSIPIWTALFGWIFLHEILTSTQLSAGALIISGAIILSYHRKKGKFNIVPTALILLSSVTVALQFTLFKITAVETSYWTGVFLSSIGLFLLGLCVYLANRRSRKHFNHIFKQRHYRVIGLNLANEVLDTAALLTFMFATLLGPIALVQTIHAYHPVFVFIMTAIATKLGFTAFKEDIDRNTILQKLLGIMLIGIGSAFIYLPLITWN